MPYRTGPQNSSDIKLTNSDVRSHAAAVSRQRRDNKVRVKLGWQQQLNSAAAAREVQDDASPTHKVLESTARPEASHAQRRQHMREMQFSWRAGNISAELKMSSGLRVDPFGFLRGDNYGHAVVDYFTQVIAPVNHPMYAIFNVTNIFTSYWFDLMSRDEYTHIGMAMVGAIMERLSNPSTKQSENNKINQAKALTRLRQKYRDAAKAGRNAADDITIIVVLAFANLARFLGDTHAYNAHRHSMKEMVRSRGGLDELGDNGMVKCALMQYDTFWVFKPEETALFPDARPEHIAVYPAFPLSQDLRDVFVKLPIGFQSLIVKGKISVELIEVLGRAAEASVNGISAITTGDMFNPPKRKYHDFLEACPALRLPDNTRNSIEKKICLALLIYCANTFTRARSSTSLYLASRMELTRLLGQNMDSGLQSQEHECLFWVCVVCVDSWRKDGPKSGLLPQAMSFLPMLKQMKVGLRPEVALQKFFFNQELLDGCARYLEMAS